MTTIIILNDFNTKNFYNSLFDQFHKASRAEGSRPTDHFYDHKKFYSIEPRSCWDNFNIVL